LFHLQRKGDASVSIGWKSIVWRHMSRIGISDVVISHVISHALTGIANEVDHCDLQHRRHNRSTVKEPHAVPPPSKVTVYSLDMKTIAILPLSQKTTTRL
jgi:hypothetical protein